MSFSWSIKNLNEMLLGIASSMKADPQTVIRSYRFRWFTFFFKKNVIAMLAIVWAFKVKHCLATMQGRVFFFYFFFLIWAHTPVRGKKGYHCLPSLVISTLYFFPGIVFALLLYGKGMYYSWVKACSSPAFLPPPGSDCPPDLGGWHQDGRIFFWPWHLCSWGAGVQHWPGGVREIKSDLDGRQRYMHVHFVYTSAEHKPALF